MEIVRLGSRMTGSALKTSSARNTRQTSFAPHIKAVGKPPFSRQREQQDRKRRKEEILLPCQATALHKRAVAIFLGFLCRLRSSRKEAR